MRNGLQPLWLGLLLTAHGIQQPPQSPEARNGFALYFSGTAAAAFVRNTILNTSNPAIAKMAHGFSWTAWVRFDNLGGRKYHTSLSYQNDPHAFQPLGGYGAGSFWMFGTGVTSATESSPPRNLTCWHHYAVTWNATLGDVTQYVDGEQHSVTGGIWPMAAYDGASFLDDVAVLMFGTYCSRDGAFGEELFERRRAACYVKRASFHGEIDDVAFYNDILTSAQVANMWNQPLNMPSNPKPVLAWDFDTLAELDVSRYGDYVACPNVGTAGSDYDLVLGRNLKPGSLGTYYEIVGHDGAIAKFLPPYRVPRSAGVTSCGPPRVSSPETPMVVLAEATGEPVSITTPSGAELLLSTPTLDTASLALRADTLAAAAANTADAIVHHTVDPGDGSNLTVHVLPIRPPLAISELEVGLVFNHHSMREDSLAELNLVSYNPQGSAMPLAYVIDRLPRRGTLFQALAESPSSREVRAYMDMDMDMNMGMCLTATSVPCPCLPHRWKLCQGVNKFESSARP